MIQPERIQQLNTSDVANGRYVLYWMQQSQRAEYNHALEYAIERANERRQPVLVAFGLMDDYPEANLRHYTFMLEGLQETQATLAKRGIEMVVQHGHPADVALSLARDASMIVCDRGYLRHQKQWRYGVADEAPCCVVQVESDVVVPVETASDKAEFAARTLHPKIHRHGRKFLVDLEPREPKYPLRFRFDGIDLSDVSKTRDTLKLDRSIAVASRFVSGDTAAAKRRLESFHRSRAAELSEAPESVAHRRHVAPKPLLSFRTDIAALCRFGDPEDWKERRRGKLSRGARRAPRARHQLCAFHGRL